MTTTYEITLLPITCESLRNLIRLCKRGLRITVFGVLAICLAVVHIGFYYCATLNDVIKESIHLHDASSVAGLGTAGLVALAIVDVLTICMVLDLDFKIRWCKK